jgi:hypothetical protein
MGQYFYIVNMDKKEYLHPHHLGSGLKFWEILATNIPRLLAYLLRESEDSSSAGEIGKNAGRWAKDRIVIVGDYAESHIYQDAQDNYKDISEELLEDGDFNKFMEEPEFKISP